VALADLQIALAAVDTAIAAHSATAPSGGSIEGLSIQRKTMAQLLKEREMLLKAIASDPGSQYLVVSRGVPV